MRLNKANKEIVWGFAQDLRHQDHEIQLSETKENGSYTLVVDGTEHAPETKRDVYRTLRKVDPSFTVWWENTNHHYYIQHEYFQEGYMKELFEGLKSFNGDKLRSFLAATSGDQYGETPAEVLYDTYMATLRHADENWDEFVAQVQELKFDRQDTESDLEVFKHLLEGFHATGDAKDFVWTK